eukprot:scpid35467/ scgid22781/ 
MQSVQTRWYRPSQVSKNHGQHYSTAPRHQPERWYDRTLDSDGTSLLSCAQLYRRSQANGYAGHIADSTEALPMLKHKRCVWMCSSVNTYHYQLIYWRAVVYRVAVHLRDDNNPTLQ